MITTFYIIFSITTAIDLSLITVCELILLDFLFGAFYGSIFIGILREFKPIRIKYNEITRKD